MPDSGNTSHQATADTPPHEDSRRVRIPLFPVYRELRHLLRVWPGRSKAQVTGLHSTLAQLTGTPKNPVDWTDPASWIPAKLKGDARKLAHDIWTTSRGEVNPRHTGGHWLLTQKYELLVEGSDGSLALTDRGRDFIKHRLGESESFLDVQEGLVELLTIVADSGPAQIRGFEEAWAEFLERHSRSRAPSTIRDTLRRRLNNLLDRGLIERERAKYTVTDDGLSYLERAAPEPGPRQKIQKLAKEQEAAVRESLREYLLQMDPKGFEELVGRLLEEMNYQNVGVVGQSGDGGVDVVAEIQLGVTSVREVVQAKRHKRTIHTEGPGRPPGLPLPIQRCPRDHRRDFPFRERRGGGCVRPGCRADHPHRWRQAHRLVDRVRNRCAGAGDRGAGLRSGGIVVGGWWGRGV